MGGEVLYSPGFVMYDKGVEDTRSAQKKIQVLFVVIVLVGIGIVSLSSKLYSKEFISKSMNSTSKLQKVESTWLNYSKTGEYSLRYPEEFELYDDPLRPSFYFPEDDSVLNTPHFVIEKLRDEYSRPFEKFVTEYIGRDVRKAQVPVGEREAFYISGRLDRDSEEYIIEVDESKYWVGFYNFGNVAENRVVFEEILRTLRFVPSETIVEEVNVLDGDIIFKGKKLTDWGYNMGPVLSQDKKWIAYLSQSRETVEYLNKTREGFIPASQNVWLIDSNGATAKALTKHEDFVARGNLYWIDAERLFFTDGEATGYVYNLLTGALERVFGPEIPRVGCIDACSDFYYQRFSENKKYFVVVTGGYGVEGHLWGVKFENMRGFDMSVPLTECLSGAEIEIDEKEAVIRYKGGEEGVGECVVRDEVQIDFSSSRVSID